MAEHASALRRSVGGIRFRITAIATLVVFIVLLVTSVVLVRGQERSLTHSLDESLALGADNIEAAMAATGVPATVNGFGDDDTAVQVVSHNGQVVVATENVAGEDPIAAAPEGSEAVTTKSGLPHDASSFRVLTRLVSTPEGDVILHVAAPTDDISESIDTLARQLTVAVPVVVALLAALIWMLVGRTLRPVEDIRGEVASIGASELSRRVPEPASNDEIARLARTMNEMLGRVEHSVTRQQAFVADASHELRTPLTRIRSELEVDLAHPDRSDPLATHRSVLEETEGLEHLLDDLLLLARTDAGHDRVPDALVDLDEVMFQSVARLTPSERVRVDTTAIEAVQVRGSESQLCRAVDNLIDNAAKYAKSTINCSVAERDGHAMAAVSDDGPGIPAADAERIFERFTRLDDSRTASTGGVGLGLAIVREIVIRHGGTVVAEPGSGARVVITLPVASPPT